jgi:hypothetical protein
MPYLRTLIGHPLEREPDCDLRSKNGRRIDALNLAEAIAAAEQIFEIRIVPHDPPKWFRVSGIPGRSGEYQLIDIHVHRGSDISA